MRRRSIFLAAALAVWIVGSALGTVTPATTADAAPLLKLQVAHAAYTPSLTGSTPVFVLAIGSGARPGDDVEHSLADAIHVIGLNPAKQQASIIDIPRDSWVEIPGHGTDKINAAMASGGPQLLVQLVEGMMHIKISYYALTTFWGMKSLIDGIGGLTVDVPVPMQDSYSGANFKAGKQHMNGRDVLAFSRDRHSLSSGDFGRSENQGRIVIDALTQFRNEYTKDPSVMLTWLGSGLRNITTDVPADQLMQLAFTSSHISPNDVQNIALPGTTGFEGTQSVVHLLPSNAKIYADFAKDAIISKKNVPPVQVH